MSKKMTYASTGVNYDDIDPFKRLAQEAARETAGNIERLGLKDVAMSRGESCSLIEKDDCFIAHVEEGLGTKNLVADTMYPLMQRSYYYAIAQDTVAMIVNDMITLGALPVSVAMHLAAGDSAWFKDEDRIRDLVGGWRFACHEARCVWGGGETPVLKGIVVPGTVVLSGSAWGIIKPKERLISCKVHQGDAIVLIGSSGIHANGLTLARSIADKVQKAAVNSGEGYLSKLADGRIYGEALLDPTIIYVPLIEDCLKAGIAIHYAVNVTGHGWKKLMRAQEKYHYIIDFIPEPQPVFRFIQEHGNVDDREMYATFNMGAGFALYVPENMVKRVEAIAHHHRMEVWQAGYVKHSPDEKKVIILPKGLEYRESELSIR